LKVLDQHSGTNAKKTHDNCSTAWDLKSVPLGSTSKVTAVLWERSLMPPFVSLFSKWIITNIHYGMHVHPFHDKGQHSLLLACSRAASGKILVVLNRPNYCAIFILYTQFTNLAGASIKHLVGRGLEYQPLRSCPLWDMAILFKYSNYRETLFQNSILTNIRNCAHNTLSTEQWKKD
jgi:hypothetical protein